MGATAKRPHRLHVAKDTSVTDPVQVTLAMGHVKDRLYCTLWYSDNRNCWMKKTINGRQVAGEMTLVPGDSVTFVEGQKEAFAFTFRYEGRENMLECLTLLHLTQCDLSVFPHMQISFAPTLPSSLQIMPDGPLDANTQAYQAECAKATDDYLTQKSQKMFQDEVKEALNLEALPFTWLEQITNLQAWWLRTVEKRSPMVIKTLETIPGGALKAGYTLEIPEHANVSDQTFRAATNAACRMIFGGGQVFTYFYVEKGALPLHQRDLEFLNTENHSKALQYQSSSRYTYISPFQEEDEVYINSYTDEEHKNQVRAILERNRTRATPPEEEIDAQMTEVLQSFRTTEDWSTTAIQKLETVLEYLVSQTPEDLPIIPGMFKGITMRSRLEFALLVLRETKNAEDAQDRQRRLIFWNPYAFPLNAEEKPYYQNRSDGAS